MNASLKACWNIRRSRRDGTDRFLSSLLRRTTIENGKIEIISLNNPSSKNALTRCLMLEMNQFLSDLAKSDSARVLVIRSNVEKVFSSGHHLDEVSSQHDVPGLFALCSDMMRRIRTMPQAVIAEVDGLATAAGCQLVASCDLAIASDTSSFATPGVNLGLFCSTPAVALSRSVGHKHAMHMLLTGDIIDAAHAHRIGLINTVVPSSLLQDEVRNLCLKIAGKSGEAIRIGKANYWKQVETGEVEAYVMSSATMVANLEQMDAADGIKAFKERRVPSFK